MEAAHYAVGGTGFVVLYEIYLSYFLIEFTLGEGFKEIASRILEDPWLYDYDSLNICLYNFHV